MSNITKSRITILNIVIIIFIKKKSWIRANFNIFLQWVSGADRGRVASEESLTTMSSRGSIYSVTSARSDIPRHYHKMSNPHAVSLV